MIDTYRRTDLIHEAVTAAANSARSIHGAHRAELHTIDAELTTLDARTDRLLTAIENGLNQTDAIERITANRHQANQLRQRREELTDLIATAPAGPTAEQLATITAAIREAIDQAETGTAKRVFESLVHEIRVASRRHHPILPDPGRRNQPTQAAGSHTVGIGAPSTTNLHTVIEGPRIVVAAAHAKIRSDGYRGPRQL
jgi:hypothetical protein